MKPWMTRIESNAMAAMRQLRCASVMAGGCSEIRSRVVACMFTFVSYVAKSRDSIGCRLPGVRLEPVALEDRQRLGGVDEGKPELRCLWVCRALHHRAGVYGRCVLAGRDVDIGNRVSRLLLEHRFGLPCDTRLGAPLHQKEWCLTMVDMSEDGAAVGHLGLVDRVGERLPASLLQRRLDLPRNSLEFGVRHGETDIGLPKIGQTCHVAGVALGHHNRERIGGVRHGGGGDQTFGDKSL